MDIDAAEGAIRMMIAAALAGGAHGPVPETAVTVLHDAAALSYMRATVN
jgi:hypothetical protein